MYTLVYVTQYVVYAMLNISNIIFYCKVETALRLTYIKHEKKELEVWNCYLKIKFVI